VYNLPQITSDDLSRVEYIKQKRPTPKTPKNESRPLLRPRRDGWSTEDWQAFYDKHARIAEFHGVPCSEAEALAFAWCVAERLNRDFEPSPPGRCLVCGGDDRPHDALLPCGTGAIGHAWVHSGC
jgi:hypothetical protein